MKFALTCAATALALSLLLVACGGGNDGPAAGQAPSASITSPAVGATFKAGDTISFTGTGTDPEDGALAGTRLTWWVNLHHDTHDHPLLLDTVGASGNVTIPVRGETSDILSAETLAEMTRRMPHIMVQIVPNRGHAPTLGELTARMAIRKFLAALR